VKNDAAYYESAYNPRLVVPQYADHFERWRKKSATARAALSGYLDVPYGSHSMQKLDIFRARGQSRALLVFIHGGYWRGLDKSDHSFIAAPFVERGVTVALLNYALAPSVHVQDIVLQVLQGCAWLFRNGVNFGAPAGKLFVAGHSAGGHLAMSASTHFDAGQAAATDAIDRVSSRPDGRRTGPTLVAPPRHRLLAHVRNRRPRCHW
jgi:arylformamidase